MKEVIQLYKKHKATVDNFVITLLKSLPQDYTQHADKILKNNTFIQLIYSVDASYKQISPTICKKEKDMASLNSDKSHYFTKLQLDNEGFYISNPYIHYRTGKASFTVVKKFGDIYEVLDFNLILLLEELKLIEFNGRHDKFKRGFYLLASTVLAFVAILLVAYGGYKFGAILFAKEFDFFHEIFKSIIAVTLGIAIFDLAKQIFEHEVLFHTLEHDEDRQYKVLGKFLISIIIALSIETLMVVFKIALEDYKHMLAAFYLLLGTTVMIVGLTYLYKTTKTD